MQRHGFDATSLIAGAILLLAGLRLLAGPVRLESLPLEWLGPAALVAVGVAILASLRTRSR